MDSDTSRSICVSVFEFVLSDFQIPYVSTRYLVLHVYDSTNVSFCILERPQSHALISRSSPGGKDGMDIALPY